MKILKRLLVLFVVCAMLLTMIPATVFAEESEQSTVIDSSAVNVEGTNGFGTLLSADIQEEQEEIAASGNADYVIVDLTIDSGIATVEYSALDEAVLVVAIYTEDSTQMLLSGEATVSADATEAQITFNDALPAYFMASAYMLDPETNAPLSTAFDTPMYTQEMQELLASSVEDYDEELVLNLDDTTDTNFAVYHEETVRIESQEGVNTVASVNDEDYIYVIENADESITSLQAGDIFAYPYSDEDLLLVKVAAISIDGTTVTITGEEMELEEAFSHVKIETDSDTSDITVDDSTADEGVTYEGLTEESTPATRAWEGEGGVSVSHGFSFNKTFEKDEAFGEANITFKGSASLNFGVKLSYYVSWTQRSLTFKTTFGASANVEVSGAVAATIPLGYLGVSPVPGVYISFEPEVQLEFSGKLSYTLKIESVIGFSYSKSNGFENISTPPVIESTLEIEGTFFLGFDLNPELSLISPKVVKATLSAQVGAELKAAMTGNNYSWSTKVEDEEHACDDCLAISVGIRVKLEAELKFLNAKRWTFKATILDLLINGEDMYYSFDKEVFGLGKCPYKTYKVTAVVKDSAGQTVEGATVSVDGIEDSWTTDSAGVIVTYLEGGTYTLQAVSSDMKGSKEIEISAAQKIEIPIITCGDFGAELHWSLDHNGLLSVTGSGELPDYSGVDQTPWAKYRSQIKQITMSSGVTGIGTYAFADCAQLTTVAVGSGVTHVDANAFAGCTQLTSAMLDKKVATVESNAFAGCTSLIHVALGANVSNLALNAFSGCSALRSISVDAGNATYKSDNYGVLLNRAGTQLLLIPYAFSGTYHVPAGVTSISSNAFASSPGLTAVILPESVTSLASCAFSGSNVTSVTFVTTPPSFAVDAFSGVTAEIFYRAGDDAWSVVVGNNYGGTLTWNSYNQVIASGTCGENVSWELYHYGELHISGIGAMADYDIDDEAPWSSYSDLIHTVVIEEGVTTVGLCAFKGLSSLSTAMIPEGITEIKQYAFYECSSLSTLELPDSLQTIGYFAFGYCTAWSNIVIPENVTTIDRSAFGCCSAVTQIHIPDSVTSLGDQAFSLCTSLRTVTIGSGITAIDSWTFSGDSSLTTVIIPANVTSIGSYAFENCTGLTNFVIPGTVKSVGIYAFSGCAGLQSLTIGNGVEQIGDHAFSCCSGLKAVTVPGTVTSVGTFAFTQCASLEKVTFAKGVTTIGMYAFSYCTSLTDVTFSSTVTTIAENAFLSCTGLKTIVVPDTVTSIGEAAFHGCSSLESMTLPFVCFVVQTYNGEYRYPFGYIFGFVNGGSDLTYNYVVQKYFDYGYNAYYSVSYSIPTSLTSVTVTGGRILNGTFYGCTNLTSIVIGDGVTVVAEGAFTTGSENLKSIQVDADNPAYCSDSSGVLYDIDKTRLIQAPGCLTGSYTIPDTVVDIENYAFYKCAGLTSIEIPNKVLNIGGSAFAECNSLTSVVVPDNTTSLGRSAFEDCSNLKSVTIGKNVSRIEAYTFRNCTSLTSVSLTSGLERIGEYAFSNCVSLSSVTIPSSVFRLDNYAFSDCDSLTSVTIPSGVTTISSAVFANCDGLKSVTIQSGVTSLGSKMFYNCTSLTSVSIPSSVTSLGSQMFYNCSSLTSVSIPSSVTSIGSYAFANCTSLKTVMLPSSVTSIESCAFNNCSSLTSVSIPSGVTGIGGGAFQHCTNLTSVAIPSSVTSIGGAAFENCTSLTSVTIPSGVTTIENSTFSYCSSLTSVTIPSSVTSIGMYAFQYCSGITSLTIGNGVTSIGDKAFFNCDGLTSVIIPDKVVSIERSAFRHCDALKTVIVGSSVTSIGNYAFMSCPNLVKITFKGDPPTMGTAVLRDVTADLYYPSNNSKWTASARDSISTSLTWVAYIPSKKADIVIETETTTETTEATETIETTETLVPQGIMAEAGKRIVVTRSTSTVSQRTAYFSELVAGQEYIFLAVKSTETENLVASDNLLYIDQLPAGEDGTLTVDYIPRENCSIIYTLAICAPYQDIADAKITIPNMSINGELQMVEPTVVYDGITLIEGTDYTLSGAVSFTEAGNYTLYVNGIGDYIGTASCEYKVYGSQEGVCGDDLTWKITDNSVLTISGTGSMTSYASASAQPWYGNYDIITKVVIESGVTTIGNTAFRSFVNLTSVSIPGTVTSIGNNAFYDCTSLQSIVIPDSVTNLGGNAFRGSGLKTITLGEGVTTIGNSCFYSCAALEKVVIPATVTSIGTTAFGNCSSLTEIRFAGNAPSFGSTAFSGTTVTAYYTVENATWTESVLQNYGGTVTWQAVYSTSGTCGEDLTWKLSDDGVLIISGTGAMTNFASVSAQPWYGHRDTIQTVILYSGVTTIGNTAFRGCTNLSAVTFSGKLTSIGNNAFYDCSSLKKINIPGCVQTLGANAFRGSGLESVRLNEGLTTIGNNCFYYCKSLESIKLPASLTSLGTNAFGGCSSLFKVYFKGDAPTIGDTAFSGITATACYPVDNTTWTSSVMQNYGGTITWKATYPTEGTCGENLTWELDAYDTLRIYGTGAMTNYSAVTDLPWYGHSADIKRVVVGSGITTVGNSAFRGCTALTKIELADTVTAIGNNAFYDCTALVAVTVPGHVQTVGNNAFRGCTALRSLTIEEGVTSIGANCFYDDSNLDSVTIPASMTNVGNTCFGRCTSLTEITFLGDAPTFGTSVFYNVAATAYYYFENATWTSDVMANYSGSITWQAIYPTSGTCGENLTWVLEEDGTLTISGIGEMTNYSTAKTLPWYGGIDTIRKIVLEDGVTTVGNSAFRDCINVSEIVFSDTLVSIGNNGFYNCAEVTELTIPGHVLTVGDNAFRGMPKLSSLTIEEGVTSIGANCFYDDSLLTTVTLPASITNVGNTCFGRCTSLREVTFLGDAPTFGYSVFYNTVITAYYPAGNTSWTSDIMANYSGDTTWVAYAELFSFAGATATLGGKLQLDFVFDGTKVTGTDNYAVITKYDASGTVADAVTVQQADWGTYGGTLKQVSYSNIAAKEMGDTITVVIYSAKGVQLTEIYEDSYLAYATRALASTTNQEMRTVFVDMLNYGAAAQTQFGYNTVNLVNANLTETQKGWATADVTMTNNQVKGTGYVGSTLTLESEIQLDFMFNRSVIGTDNTKLYAIATYTDHNGNEKSVRIEGSAFGAYGSYTQISVTGMVIADYASLVTCTVYDIDGNKVGSGADSVESYASRASSSTSTVALTAVAIAKFGASAYAYFH